MAFVPGSEGAIAGTAIVADQASDLRTPGVFGTSTARSILIAPGEFLAPANRLATYRRGQGYAVEVASVEDVYDEFNGGVKSARAIRRYLHHAYSSWSPAPSFVALMGDASFDYRHDREVVVRLQVAVDYDVNLSH